MFREDIRKEIGISFSDSTPTAILPGRMFQMKDKGRHNFVTTVDSGQQRRALSLWRKFRAEVQISKCLAKTEFTNL